MHRLGKSQALQGSRDHARDRKTRTRHLIELGGLIVKAGLVDLLEDDRAALLGLCLEAAEDLRGFGRPGEQPVALKARWRQRGQKAFASDAQAARHGKEEVSREKSLQKSQADHHLT